MTRTEERLTDALAARAAAVAADSIRPLPAREAGHLHWHPASRRWSVSIAPLAAAASIAAIAGALAMLPQHHRAGPAQTGMPKSSSLLGVAAVSASDAWAVGLVITGRRTHPLIMHWNGTRWTRSPITAGVTSQQFLCGVAAASARDAWAVGAAGDKASILHWSGSAWTQVPTPRLTVPAELSAVSVASATDVWAVGEANGALILHWDGTRWRNVPNPWRRVGGALYGVSARSVDDVWAVGKAGSNSLILHWNGVSWTRLGGPRYGRYGSGILGVAAVSPRLAWLVGRAKDGLPLILRWNGSTLRQTPRPRPAVGGALTGVAAASAGQAWAVGAPFHGVRGQHPRTWIFRWQAGAWLRVPSPARRVAGNLLALFALSAKNAWAVGYTGFGIGTGSRGFILHWDGTSWQPAA